MSNQKTSIIFILMILLSTASGFPLKHDKQLQGNFNSALRESSFKNLSSNDEINNVVSTMNSTAVSGPRFSMYAIIGMGVGGALAVLGILALPAVLGFTSAGIAAGSTAAAMMSSSAVASGGGVAAGSLVAMLQSAGILGVTASTAGLAATGSAGTIGASIGYGIGYATENYFTPVSIAVTDAYNSVHKETVYFFTGNGTKSWKSFANLMEANVDYAVFKIKNGTVDSWEKVRDRTISSWNTLANWTTVNVEPVMIKLKNGTAETWNSFSNWTVVNSEILTNQVKDAWNNLAGWTTVNTKPAMIVIKNGTVETWNSFSNWTIVNSNALANQIKDGTIDAWRTFSNWTIVNGKTVENKIENGTVVDALNLLLLWVHPSSSGSGLVTSTPFIIFLSIFWNSIGIHIF